MSSQKSKIRLFVPGAYQEGQVLALSPGQSHYLASVMRARTGEGVAVFNGTDGQWLAEIVRMDKKSVTLLLKMREIAQAYSPDIWLAFAPIKNKTDLVVEKATELGVSKILPVTMQHSVVRSINHDKLFAHAVEAAEQCERHDIPAIETARDLPTLLGTWPKDRTLLYGDESGNGAPLGDVLKSLPQGKYALLIGPEGGFSKLEHQMLAAVAFAKPFSMGPRILRADTAAVAALACLQSALGDWADKPHFASAL